ncbi:MAG TPA: DUF4197 domain-containing protein [Bacteroidales bacterium]|nr:DUF4197 domain-containing protein [Bacteroidales bacterium]
MKIKISIITVLLVFSMGCAELMNIVQTSGTLPLTEADVIAGLKEALSTGARNSAQRLGAENGYYNDAAIRILLPDDAKTIVDNISKLPGGQKLVDDAILRINRAAEDAAREAAPIFINSITNMSVADAFGILRGSDNAATAYLQKTTYNELYNLYKPKITASTEKDLVGGISTKESWETLTSRWNAFAASMPGKIAGMKPVNTDLDDYLTNMALKGMFSKIETEELRIRKDVSARVTPLLQRVFGSADNTTK